MPAAGGARDRSRGACTGKPPPPLFMASKPEKKRRRWPWTPALRVLPPPERPAGCRGQGDVEDALLSSVRGHAESMISWAKSDEALALEHDAIEERAMADGLELMRLLAEAHMALRAAREERRGDVRDADGDLRVTCEDGQEHTRVMIFGPVRTWRAAYRRRGYLENKQDYLGLPRLPQGGLARRQRPHRRRQARWLIKDRMEVTGARWSLNGAEAVLKLRALAGNGDFDEYFDFHLKQEKLRNHDSRYQQPQPRAA